MRARALIYFVRFADDGPIKIGQTINLEKRLGCYRSQHGKHAQVLGVMDGGRIAEKRILERFDHLRISKSVVNEWRHPGSDLLEFIKTYCRPWGGENDMPTMRQEVVCTLKADERVAPAIKEWVDELAAFVAVNTSVLFDIALAHYAKEVGFTKKKPRRQMTKRRAS